jgi:hypothetical protein
MLDKHYSDNCKQLYTISTGLATEWFSCTLVADEHGYNNNAEYEKNSKLPM